MRGLAYVLGMAVAVATTVAILVLLWLAARFAWPDQFTQREPRNVWMALVCAGVAVTLLAGLEHPFMVARALRDFMYVSDD